MNYSKGKGKLIELMKQAIPYDKHNPKKEFNK